MYTNQKNFKMISLLFVIDYVSFVGMMSLCLAL